MECKILPSKEGYHNYDRYEKQAWDTAGPPVVGQSASLFWGPALVRYGPALFLPICGEHPLFGLAGLRVQRGLVPAADGPGRPAAAPGAARRHGHLRGVLRPADGGSRGDVQHLWEILHLFRHELRRGRSQVFQLVLPAFAQSPHRLHPAGGALPGAGGGAGARAAAGKAPVAPARGGRRGHGPLPGGRGAAPQFHAAPG